MGCSASQEAAISPQARTPCAAPAVGDGGVGTEKQAIVNVLCSACGKLVPVKVAPGVAVQMFSCPGCHVKVQFNVPGLQAPAGLEREEAALKEDIAPLLLPDWWQIQPSLSEPQLLPVSQGVQNSIQRLMDSTWKDVTSRDRKTGAVSKLRVVQVQQNHNAMLWRRYLEMQERIRNAMAGDDSALLVTPMTAEAQERSGDVDSLGYIDPSINEALLFHGTQPSACASICRSDFKIGLAGTHVGTLYGPGIYFSESSSKSDEYASDEQSGIYSGLYAMLLCRVTCGRMLYSDEVQPEAAFIERCCHGQDASFHSCLGDRERARGTYREFVIYDPDQVYPEYVIIYRRVPVEEEKTCKGVSEGGAAAVHKPRRSTVTAKRAASRTLPGAKDKQELMATSMPPESDRQIRAESGAGSQMVQQQKKPLKGQSRRPSQHDASCQDPSADKARASRQPSDATTTASERSAECGRAKTTSSGGTKQTKERRSVRRARATSTSTSRTTSTATSRTSCASEGTECTNSVQEPPTGRAAQAPALGNNDTMGPGVPQRASATASQRSEAHQRSGRQLPTRRARRQPDMARSSSSSSGANAAPEDAAAHRRERGRPKPRRAAGRPVGPPGRRCSQSSSSDSSVPEPPRRRRGQRRNIARRRSTSSSSSSSSWSSTTTDFEWKSRLS